MNLLCPEVRARLLILRMRRERSFAAVRLPENCMGHGPTVNEIADMVWRHHTQLRAGLIAFKRHNEEIAAVVMEDVEEVAVREVVRVGKLVKQGVFGE